MTNYLVCGLAIGNILLILARYREHRLAGYDRAALKSITEAYLKLSDKYARVENELWDTKKNLSIVNAKYLKKVDCDKKIYGRN
jgi:hypothetical protein